MADSAELRMSVTSIKRVDPYVKDILATATQVVVYEFNVLASAWEKQKVEGALFLYSRNGEPYHSIMVMNRLSTENHIEPIVKDLDHQLQLPFLLYRNSKNKIFGFWFFDREEAINITLQLETIMDSLRDKARDKNKNQENGVDIFSLLSKAQEDFNKTPTKRDSTPAAFSTPRVVDDGTSKSVMDFFAKAGTKSSQKHVATGGDGENVLQRIMGNPVHTVEHIEKQQRSITPQEQVPLKKPNPDRHSVPISFSNTTPSAGVDTRDPLENGISFLGLSPSNKHFQGSSPLAFLLQGQLSTTTTTTTTTMTDETSGDMLLASSPFAQFLDNAQKPMLMTPMMFTAAEKADLQQQQQQQILQQSPPQQTSAENNSDKLDLLTEKQLAQALIHLLKTNSDFTRQIHEAYVNSIMERVKCPTSNSLI